ITCPANVTLAGCNGTVPAPNIANVTVSDGCGNATVTFVSDATDTTGCTEVTTRTYQAVDACGNVATCLQTITRTIDNTPPSITCPANVTVECTNDVPLPDISLVTVNDACGDVLVSVSPDVISDQICPNQYTISRQYTARDDCGNIATCVQTILVNDTIGPLMSCVGEMNFSCADQLPPPDIATIMITENCGGDVTVTVAPDVITDQTCPNHFTLTRTYIGTDACGNSTNYVQVFMVDDQTPPAIQCPANITVSCTSEIPVADPHTVSTTDNCSGNVIITVAPDKVTSLLCPDNYVITRVYTATDLCGNTATCAQTIYVQDNTPPTIICPEDITVSCNEIPEPSIGSVFVTDDCTGPVTILHVSDDTIGVPCSFTIERTYSATDACGNVNTCLQVISVIDSALLPSPILIVAADLTVQCYGQDSTWNIPLIDEHHVTVSGGCMDNPTVTFVPTIVASDSCDRDGYIAIYTYTWTATDTCGNIATAVSHMTVMDTIPPVIHGVPADITISADSLPTAYSVYATDECLCACVMLIEDSQLSPGCLNGQVITRTWKSTDACGNESVKSQRITITDLVAPVLSLQLPEDFEIENGDEFEFSCSEGGMPDFMNQLNSGSIIDSDTIENNMTVEFEVEQIQFENCEPHGFSEENVFIWTAEDACGNSAVFSFTARLIDDEAPEILGVPDFICMDDPALDSIEAVDNCSEHTLSFMDAEIVNPCGSGTAMRRIYTAEDACGNISTDVVLMIPDDNINPQMSFAHPELIGLISGDTVTVECDAHSGLYTSFDSDDVKVLAACPQGVHVVFEEQLISTEDCKITGSVGYVRLLWTATDYCGNSGTALLIARIEDETPPVILNFATDTVECNEDLPLPEAVDNCSEVGVIYFDHIVPGVCESEYDIIRSITAIDQCGNTSLVMQSIHVGNEEGPVMEGIEPVVCDDMSMPDVSAFDECEGVFVAVSMTQDTVEGSCQGGIVIRRTWIAEDACNHLTEIEQLIVIGDTSAPVISIPNNSVILQFIGQDTIPLVLLSNTTLMNALNALNAQSVRVIDACEQVIVPLFNVSILLSDSVHVDGFTEQRRYSWIAADICGNADTIAFTVNILDDMPPVVDLPEDMVVVCAPLPEPDAMIPIDSTDIYNIEYSETIVPGNRPGEFLVTRTWTLTDASGNSSVIIQRITWIPDTFIECDIITPDYVGCNSRNVIISSHVTGGYAPYTYLWDIQGEDCAIQGGQNSPEINIYVGWADVHITLYVTDAFGCLTICQAVVSCAGDGIPYMVFKPAEIIDDRITQVSIGPSPANEFMTVGYEATGKVDVTVSFHDFMGRSVQIEQFAGIKGKNEHRIDINPITNGVYLVRVETPAGMVTKPIVIMNDD
ncbi:MAG TPA: T9SS type A sorting domain-containing protein, partial [Saprospiraceae bacterium]